MSKTITLFTKIFGRGTDFVVNDKTVSANGGVFVIQTFLSEQLTEEIQIKGRTARQSEEGSYRLILNKDSLEKFGINPEKVDSDDSKLYEFLNEKRNDFFEKQYSENIKHVDKIKTKHIQSCKFLQDIFSGDFENVKKFLLQQNRGAESSTKSRTLIMLDGTGSMTTVLEKTKKTLETMFSRLGEVLIENKFNSQSFEIKIAVYRNYNSSVDMILQTSAWENKPVDLVNFLQLIYPEGGWGEEAIEIGLWQANNELNDKNRSLSQVIIIGDAPPNSKENVFYKRRKSHKLWENSKFREPTFYMNELEKLKSNKIPVHTFYVANFAKQAFEEIAEFTNGKCEELDIESPNGAESLTNLINVTILNDIGGELSGEDLVKAYRTKYSCF